MSVFVKGMEMPKGCRECNFCNEINFEGYLWFDFYCRAKDKSFDLDKNKDKPNWCPLVEVPPHGRLIDADALKEEGADIHMDYVCDGYVEDTTWGYSDDLLDSQPTIIEAEE